MEPNKETPPPKDPALASLDFMATLMDNQFRIPATNVRFGLDSLIGLIPGVGDGIGLVIGAWLMSVMIRKGAGPLIMLRMLGNIILDALVGAIPFLGDIFDFGFKSNRRNVDMLQKYYADGKAKPNAKWAIALLSILFFGLIVLIGVGAWYLSKMIWGWAFG